MCFPYGTKICFCHFASDPCNGLQQGDCQCTCEYPCSDKYTVQPKDTKPGKECMQSMKSAPKKKSKLTRTRKDDEGYCDCENDYIVKTKVKIQRCKCK